MNRATVGGRMVEPLSKPFTLSYEGGEASEHRVDAIMLGQSLQGAGRLYNSVAHFWFYRQIPKRLVPTIRVSVGPPQEGSITYLIYLLMVHGHLPVFPSLLFEFADLAMPAFVKAIIARRAGVRAELEKALTILGDTVRANDELAAERERNDAAQKAQMLTIIDKLTDSNRPALADMAKPVGRSVKQITQFKDTPQAVVIDEPLAAVLRSKEDLMVGEIMTFRGRLLAVDKAAATCRVEIEGGEKLVRGKITDPVLGQPGNVYTHSLDTDRLVTITAKPVLRDGEITTLFISDAREAA